MAQNVMSDTDTPRNVKKSVSEKGTTKALNARLVQDKHQNGEKAGCDPTISL